MHSLSSKAVCCKDSLVKVLQNGGSTSACSAFRPLRAPRSVSWPRRSVLSLRLSPPWLLFLQSDAPGGVSVHSLCLDVM